MQSPAEIKARLEDNAAVDAFAIVMRHKMTRSREKGRAGWQDCHPQQLWQMLREHVEKGDPRDIACLAMMIYFNQRKL